MKAQITAVVLAFRMSTLAGSPSTDPTPLEIRQAAAAIKETEFARLLSEVKQLQKKGDLTYLPIDIQSLPNNLLPISPKLIIVRRNSVEFVLSSDLNHPVVLVFWRAVGVWTPGAVLWSVDLKAMDKAAEVRLWSKKEMLSEAEAEVEMKLNHLEMKSREEAPSDGR
jgi:hypothetical protein